MFLLKETSRNAFNNDMSERFKENYFRIFKMRLPHMDTAHTFLASLAAFELEDLKAAFVATLIEQKMFHKFRLLGQFYMVAIDGTGVSSYTTDDAEKTRLHKTSKNGTVTYSYYVVEAKLVTSSGFAISLASEWVANQPHQSFKKQDCEQRAFERLAIKLKKYFPRLPICLLADGLYPNKTFMKTCKDNDWQFVVVLKDDTLTTLQQDIKDVENKNRQSFALYDVRPRERKEIATKYEWIAEPLSHGSHTVYWLGCTETITTKDRDGKNPKQDITRFVYLSSIEVNKNNVRNLAKAGRMRWKIENEGFNTQKNGGYNLGHKYARNSFTCYKNYYQLMQIAHLINQLVEQSENIDQMLNASVNSKLTIKHIWKDMISIFKAGNIEQETLDNSARTQIRMAT